MTCILIIIIVILFFIFLLFPILLILMFFRFHMVLMIPVSLSSLFSHPLRHNNYLYIIMIMIEHLRLALAAERITCRPQVLRMFKTLPATRLKQFDRKTLFSTQLGYSLGVSCSARNYDVFEERLHEIMTSLKKDYTKL